MNKQRRLWDAFVSVWTHANHTGCFERGVSRISIELNINVNSIITHID
jgi:hypothetical protein